ncbi:hypothetical protein EV175_002366 [Coemansia sp. RSA 1933]|nr:hypothetical protein EV175_002366 [Coemansia sp. RSA 1933]
MTANESTADGLPPEPLPPYTLLDETPQAPAETTHNSQSMVPPGFEQAHADSWTSASAEKELFDTIQCIEATEAMTFMLAGIRGACVSVCTDDGNLYSGHVCVQTRCTPWSADTEYPVSVECMDNGTEIRFELDARLCGQKAEELRSEYRITVPLHTMRTVVLRLSEDSHLDMRRCRGTENVEIDVAAVEGTVTLGQLSIRAMRVAIQSGTVDVRGVQCSGQAQFAVKKGRLRIHDVCAQRMRINAPGAAVTIGDTRAHDVTIETQTAPVELCRVNATDTMDVKSGSGAIGLDGVAAAFLTVLADTATVEGVWMVGQQLKIVAAAAVVNGRLCRPEGSHTGCNCTIRTRGMPVHMQVDADFAGSFDLRANGGIVRFDLAAQHPATSFSQYFQTWMQGTINSFGRAYSPYSLFIENENAPIVVTTA